MSGGIKQTNSQKLLNETPYALKFVPFSKIEDHFKLGWMMMIPNASHHHLAYGCEMKWICACRVPGGFKTRRSRK